jgi:polyisoprenoid-binding protein YceI
MKSRILLFIITICSLTLSTAQQQPLKINTSTSQIKWIGEYTFYFGGHDGTIDFKEGYFLKMGDVITGGEFIIDMTSIKCLDIESQEGKDNLVNHLKDPDFFDVANHKDAKLFITSVTYNTNTEMKIHADLIIKGHTNSIKFNAEVDYEKEQMTARFKIDRTLWGINYNSSLQDKSISDAIGFEVTLNLK